MAVKIGHASLDERGKATGGSAGDQTAKEVCTRNWYNKGWNVLLRPTSAALAEKSAQACEAACNNSKIGYDQNGRNTLNTKAKAVGYDLSKITDSCECDCSSLMHVCAIAGGANLAYGSNGYTTRTMAAAFAASGNYQKLTASKYLTSDKYLKRGDILVKEGSHTVMVLEDGAQAGADTSTAGATPAKKDTVTIYYSVRLPLLVHGSEGPAVENLQHLLLAHGEKLPKYGTDGDFGAETGDALESYQRKNSLTVDRKCGPESWLHLLTK
jgi:peptidoglycan hydrolase-like protein with peptidoglycan-binding domain